MKSKQTTAKPKTSFDASNIVWLHPESLVPYANNTKKHETAQIDKIAASIAAYGFDQPIVVDEKKVIIKGHGRREASMRLGLESVPVLVRTDLSPAQVKAARIADNRVSVGEFDESLLKIEFEDLHFDNFDMSLTGFDNDEISKLLTYKSSNEIEKTSEKKDKAYQPVAMPGDIWILGSHLITVGSDEPGQVDEMIRNFQKKTGKDAILDATNETFKTVSEKRNL